MRFVHLTDLDGHSVAVAREAIVMLRPPGQGYGPTAKTLIVFGSTTQAVRETMAEVEAKLKDD